MIAIDQATSTGIAIVGYENKGPAVYLKSARVKLPIKSRMHWYAIACETIAKLFDEMGMAYPSFSHPEQIQWVIENWSHHRNFRDATRLAQIQQVWIDIAAAMRAEKEPVLYHVQSWQASIGAGSLKSKIHGPKARKEHAQLWAEKSYRLDEPIHHDIADALCMASVWIMENRHKQESFGFRTKAIG